VVGNLVVLTVVGDITAVAAVEAETGSSIMARCAFWCFP
jgi:hypothetical protein